MNFTSKELWNIIEWFHVVEDTNRSYLDKRDFDLYDKISKMKNKLDAQQNEVTKTNSNKTKDPLWHHPHRWCENKKLQICCMDCGYIDPVREARRLGKYKVIQHDVIIDGYCDDTRHEYIYEDSNVESDLAQNGYCPEPYSNRHHPNLKQSGVRIIPMTEEQVKERFGYWTKNK